MHQVVICIGSLSTAGGAVNRVELYVNIRVNMAAAAGLILPGDGIMIAGKLYSRVALTLENCLLPPESVHCSPSRAHGLSARTEEQLRIRMCEMIQNAGVLLRLPQVAMATAQILFHRFFYCKSFVRHCAETVAMACLQLASKIEEEPRRVIVMYLQVLECEKNTRLLQIAWNYMNDSLRTDVFLRFSAETVACACIFLSARVLQIPLPDQPPWFSLFGTSEQDLIEISCCILRLYTLRCESLTALQQQVEESRLKLDAQYHTSKPGGLASATDTPTRDPAAGFSPASKAASPAENQKNHESPLSHLALKNVCRKISSREGRKRLSRSDERRSIPSPPRRRRSRSVSSPSRPVSPGRSKSYRHRQREREREQRKGRSSHRR
ncbi:Cyclin-L2 [Anabarilius grahami]|uniref:Cyclin-L2 n=1 Tax=Anabarilius grahami TaxID=495550 RepID=A0A3N0YGI4_ANAGA|nr:Cyclin-L2 [Anabarilius grahami]